jgi:hypothetical protein
LLRIAGTIGGLLLATAMFHLLPPGTSLERSVLSRALTDGKQQGFGR